MKTIQLTLTLLFVILATSTYAQPWSTTHLTFNKKYDFCLPQVEVAVTVPAHVGFLPVFETRDKRLTNLKSDYYVVCFFDTTLIGSNYSNYISFEFGGGKNREYLYLYFQTKDKPLTRQWVSQEKGFIDFITPISTKMGKAIGYTLEKGNKKVTTYAIENGNYKYIFLYSSDLKAETKKKIDNMIKSFAVREMPNEIRLYDNREDLKELEKDIEATKAVINYNDLQQYKDRTTTQATFEIDEAGISLEMPKGTNYTLSGTEFEHKDNIYRVKAETIDPAKQMNMYNLFHKDLNVSVKVYYGEEEVPEWFKNMLSGDMYHFSEKIKLNIDGVILPGNVEGSKERDFLTNLNAYYFYENKLVWLTFYSLSQKNEALLNKILSSIRLNIPNTRVAVESKPLTKVFKFNKFKDVAINKNIKFPKVQSTPTLINIPQLKLEFGILGDFDKYQMRTNFKDSKPLTSKIINKIPQEIDDDLTLQIYDNNGGMNVSLTRINPEDKIPLAEESAIYTKSYSGYKMYKMIETGLANYNEIEWVVLITDVSGRFTASMHTYIGDYKLTVYIYGNSLESVMKQVGVLETFKLRK